MTSTPNWPLSVLPRIPEAGSPNERPQPFVSEFDPDVGPPSRWPRSSKVLQRIDFTLFLTADERAELFKFYIKTCKAGTLPFTMADPITDIGHTWYWVSPPTSTPVVQREQFRARISIQRLWDGT